MSPVAVIQTATACASVASLLRVEVQFLLWNVPSFPVSLSPSCLAAAVAAALCVLLGFFASSQAPFGDSQQFLAVYACFVPLCYLLPGTESRNNFAWHAETAQ